MMCNKYIKPVLFLLFLQYASVALAEQLPQKEAEAVTRQLLATFDKNVQKYKKDDSAFIAEVDRQLSPVVAFDSIARGVMGKYARRAKAKQIEQFTKVFKNSLISFYAKALLKLDETRLTIEKVDEVPKKVLKNYKAGKARLIPVDMTVRTSTGVVALSYSMVFKDDRWKVRNIIVDGINIGIQFRNQFADAMSKHGDLQYVVDNWADIMKGVATKTSKAKKK